MKWSLENSLLWHVFQPYVVSTNTFPWCIVYLQDHSLVVLGAYLMWPFGMGTCRSSAVLPISVFSINTLCNIGLSVGQCYVIDSRLIGISNNCLGHMLIWHFNLKIALLLYYYINSLHGYLLILVNISRYFLSVIPIFARYPPLENPSYQYLPVFTILQIGPALPPIIGRKSNHVKSNEQGAECTHRYMHHHQIFVYLIIYSNKCLPSEEEVIKLPAK